jgi:hypothetical protein
MFRKSTRAIAIACTSLIVAGCAEPVSTPIVPSDPTPAFTSKPGEPGAAADRILYQVRLGDLNGSQSHGVILIEIVGGYLAVTVHAAGLDPDQNIPQHIHEFATCALGGPALINLDDKLTVRNEAPGVGPAYPTSNRAGVVKYYARRPLTDLLAAANTYVGANVTTVEELLEWLNLDERNAHMHGFAPPFTPMNCGELERIN